MRTLTLSHKEFLDDFILGIEFARKAEISSNAYLYWKNGISAKYDGSRTVFLQKQSIPVKFKKAAQNCSSLSGLVSSYAFCTFTGLASSHLVKSNNSKMYKLLRIVSICGIKFVDLRKFYDDLNLSYDYHLYIEKCHFFSPNPLEKKIKLTETMCVGYY